jgi:hypothetical protein
MPKNNLKQPVAVGDRFHRLLVLELSHQDKRWRRHYLVRCDCGTEKTVQGTLLRSGNTRSCGCLSTETKQAKRLPNNHGEITAIILGYKRHAKSRGLDWHINRDQASELIREPCHYCGAIAGNIKKTKNYPQGFPYNGLDRADNSQGYLVGNVVPCCGVCNRAKGTRTAEEFIYWAKLVVSYRAGTDQWGVE